jgi:hypothetical protein
LIGAIPREEAVGSKLEEVLPPTWWRRSLARARRRMRFGPLQISTEQPRRPQPGDQRSIAPLVGKNPASASAG